MTDAIRINIVLPDLRLGGAQRVLLGLSRQLVALGHDVEIVTLVNDGELLCEIPPRVRHHALTERVTGGTAGLAGLAAVALPRLIRHLRTTRPEAVLSSMTGTNLLVVIAHTWAGRPGRLVLREAAGLRNRPDRMTQWLMRRCYCRADALLAVSAGVAQDLVGLGLDPAIIKVVHNPIDSARIRLLASAGSPARSRIEGPYVVSVGRLTAQKDQRTLLRAYAASTLRQSHRLVIVGEGDERPALGQLARELRIDGSVEFAGALSNPYPIIAGAALHVLSSRWEGYPNVLLEALALGVPVVSTDCPAGPRELFQDGRFGRLVPVGDHIALAKAMDAELAAPAAERGLALAAHELEAVARRYLAVLLGVREEGRA